VIETIKRLPREEQELVVSFVHTLEGQKDPGRPDDGVSEEFKRLAHEAFTINAELYRKLAQ